MSANRSSGEVHGSPSAVGLFVALHPFPAAGSDRLETPDLPAPLAAHPELMRLCREAAETGSPRTASIFVSWGDVERRFDVRVAVRPDAPGLLIAAAEATVLEDAERAAREERAARLEAEALRRLVDEHGCDWDYLIGADGRLQWVSPSCETITGYPVEAFLADPHLLIDLVHPDDRERVRHQFEASFQTLRPLRSEFRIVTRTGEVRAIEHLCQPVVAPEGVCIARRASNRDVTERRAAEAEAERHLGELEAIYANAPIGLGVLDTDLRYLRINERLAQMNGPSVAEHVGRTFDEVVPELSEHAAPLLRRAIKTGEAVLGMEVRGTTPAQPGVERVWLASWIPVKSSGRITGLNLVVEEITARRRVEEALRESEQRFRAMAELVPDIVFATDPTGRCVYANPRFYAYTGMAAGAALGLEWMAAVHPDDRERVTRVWLGSVAAGQPTGFRYRLRGSDGGYRWFQTRAHPLRDDAGAIVRWFGVVSDIHPLISTQEALEEADRRKDEFLAILGHELRNPMAPIRNAAEVIRMVGAAEPQLRWAAEVLDQQTKQMARLLDDLLDLPRITRGTLKLDVRTVEIGEVIQQSVDTVRPLLQERRHALTLDLPPGELWVRADPARLLQVVVNLLTNANKYSEPGGKVHLAARAEGEQVVVEVRDGGRGLAPEMAERMFEPFARGHDDGPHGTGGLGLGLTVAHRLVDLHGGRIEVKSAGYGHGATFLVYLPRAAAAPEPAAPAAEPPPERPHTTPLRILVVDDNPVVARTLGILLRLIGHEVEIAHSGEEALGAARRFRPRVALLDIGMRGMDGLELARRLRAEVPERERLMLVAVTGYGDQGARERSRAAGFEHHLVKPVDRRTLIELLTGVDDPDRPPAAA